MSSFSMILFSLLGVVASTQALGINCDGSALCVLATLEQAANQVDVMQAFRGAMKYTDLPGTTAFYEGEHIICISNELGLILGPNLGPAHLGFNIGLKTGGICMFPEKLPRGAAITLTQARNYTDLILGHGCTTCGAVPIDYPQTNNVANGQLKIDYVGKPVCTANCIWQNNHQASGPSSSSASRTTSTTASTTATSVIVGVTTTLSRASTLPTTSSILSTSSTSSRSSTSVAQATVTVTATSGSTHYHATIDLGLLLGVGILIYNFAPRGII